MPTTNCGCNAINLNILTLKISTGCQMIHNYVCVCVFSGHIMTMSPDVQVGALETIRVRILLQGEHSRARVIRVRLAQLWHTGP
jgi:hypothetical protein